MFSLLRERVRRKKKNKNKNNNDDNNVPKVLENKQFNEHNTESSNARRQYLERSDGYQNNAERILPTAVVAAAHVGTSISDTQTTKTKDVEEEEEVINNGITNNIARKIYFENAQNNDKRQYLAKTNENFAFEYNANGNGNIDNEEEEEESEEEKCQRQRQQVQRQQRQRVKDLSNDLMVCGFSHNVPAEWQRRVLTIGEKNEILPNRNTTTAEAKVININKHNSQAFNCELVELVEEERPQSNENVEINKNQTIRADTSNRNNEVKYRNLDKSTSRNEGKRQSRLSFTLAGINFGNKPKKKEVDERQLENEAHKIGPLQKSREYLNSLFMARGRQHNRHQRHQQQNQQQQHLVKEQTKNVTYNSGGANNELKISTCTTMSKPTESINTPIKNEKNFMNDKKQETTTTLYDQHLEPNVVRATEPTNNYQISSSAKNSVEQMEAHECRERARERNFLRSEHSESQRSNSATILRSHSASPLPRNKRSRSVTFNEEVECFGEARNVWLNNGDDWISRTSQIERNGVENSNTANENFALHTIVPNTNSTHGEGGVDTGALATAKLITSTYQNPSLNQIDTFTTPTTSTLHYNMGQTNTKPDVTTRDFRESSVMRDVESPINVETPTITVADYSAPATHVDREEFYEIDNNEQMHNYNDSDNSATASDDDAVFYDEAPNMHDQYVKWQTPNNNGLLSQTQMRHSHAKLEDVREEEEEEEEETEEEEDDEDEEEEESSVDEPRRPRHLDNEHYNSTERSPLKSSDTTLSGSASDSGIGTDSQPTTPLNVKSRHSPTYPITKPPKAPTTTQEVLTQQQKLRQQIKQKYNFMSFVRDGNSTDGDEMQLPTDDIELDLADDYVDDDNDVAQSRLVCIESISLPDVVVESTTISASNTTLNSNSSNGEHIININGATGNSMGNIHFIPIHVEGGNNNGSAKKRSLDDSVIGAGNSIEITEDASVMNGFVVDNRQVEKLK